MAVNKLLAFSMLTLLYVAPLLSTLTSQTTAKVSRVRRQGCQDGTYDNNGIKCCKCPIGSKVEVHCTLTSETRCEPCEAGKDYQSHANPLTTCEPCTSCSHLYANLVVDRHCTRAQDATCKCKENHYCPSGKTPCKVCEPCDECGPQGIKVACSATNNTICNEEPKDNSLAIALGVTIALLLLVAVICYCIWKRRKSGRRANDNGQVESSEAAIPLQPVDEPEFPENLTPYIADIAEVIGWPLMRNLAMSSNIAMGKIESCEQDHPNSSSERTIALLKIFVEKESKNAPRKLTQYLKQNDQNSKLKELIKKLSGGSG